MTKHQFAQHIWHYGALVAILTLGTFLTLQTASDRKLQLVVILTTTLFYVLWGVFHHLIEHDLTAKIVIEYVLVGSLGASVVLFLTIGV